MTDDISKTPCPQCGAVELRIEWQDGLRAKPLGSFSLSGQQMKVSAIRTRVPVLLCGGCDLRVVGTVEVEER